jgi:S-adenosylmethionine-diacylgycerolhomoserine-N-methlytransferase
VTNPLAPTPSTQAQTDAVRGYYRWQSKIYDWTRWSFLFGREQLIQRLIQRRPRTLVELGCGTGRNLLALKRALPETPMVGVDLSWDMLRKAQDKLQSYDNMRLVCGHAVPSNIGQIDVILLSYVLTMTGPEFTQILRDCRARLSPDGVIAIVDFSNSPFEWFRRWMGLHHVQLSTELTDTLQHEFRAKIVQRRAYFGLWRYFFAYVPMRPA